MRMVTASEFASRESRLRFLRTEARAVYDSLTAGRRRFLRLDELCRRAAARFPGLLPSEVALRAEARRALADKRGLEIDQGLFVAHVLADPVAGAHLCHAMLLPRKESLELRQALEKDGKVVLPGARLERRGKASILTLCNPRYLNAEDETTLEATEIAVDLALLDPRTEVCVIRGGPIEHPKWRGRRVFGAGINLTHLYEGRIPFLWYLLRDLGYVNKLYRGLARRDAPPEEDAIEKPWIAAVESFAIGGHCQLLPVMDYVIAESDAYLTLPARKEGIVPGAANLRLARLVGERIARQAVMMERRIDCASPAGRLVCDRIVARGRIEAAIAQAISRLGGSGLVSVAANRRAFRIAQEPLDAFRRYMSLYAHEQARCHFSPALIANLEKNWIGAERGATSALRTAESRRTRAGRGSRRSARAPARAPRG